MSETTITRLFMSGDSQAVRIPRSLRLKGPEVSITRRGDEIVIREIGPAGNLREAFDLMSRLPETIDDREDTAPQERNGR